MGRIKFRRRSADTTAVDMFDLYQQRLIKNNGQQLESNERTNEFRHRRSRDEIDQLHTRLDRLVMLTEAMWQLLSEHTDLDEASLMERLEALDSSDGVTDGRRQVSPASCDCGAKVNPKAPLCQFCGAAPPPRSAFDTI